MYFFPQYLHKKDDLMVVYSRCHYKSSVVPPVMNPSKAVFSLFFLSLKDCLLSLVLQEYQVSIFYSKRLVRNA